MLPAIKEVQIVAAPANRLEFNVKMRKRSRRINK